MGTQFTVTRAALQFSLSCLPFIAQRARVVLSVSDAEEAVANHATLGGKHCCIARVHCHVPPRMI